MSAAASPTPMGLVLDDLVLERGRQISKGYDDEHDDGHAVEDLVDLALVYVSDDEPLTRERILQAAAVLVATVLSIDRRAAKGDAS